MEAQPGMSRFCSFSPRYLAENSNFPLLGLCMNASSPMFVCLQTYYENLKIAPPKADVLLFAIFIQGIGLLHKLLFLQRRQRTELARQKPRQKSRQRSARNLPPMRMSQKPIQDRESQLESELLPGKAVTGACRPKN